MRTILTAVFATFLLAQSTLAQAPGCAAVRYTFADQQAAEKRVAETEKRKPKSSELADALESLADVYHDTDPEKARATLQRVLAIREGLANKKNAVSPARTLVKIADTYEFQSKYADAMTALNRAAQLISSDHSRRGQAITSDILAHQANCLMAPQHPDFVQAENKASAAVTLAEKAYGVDSVHAYQALSLLQSAYRMTGKHKEAEAIGTRIDAIRAKLGASFVGEGTARHLDLQWLLIREERDHSPH